ncbi:MAG: PAS domain-containing protein [Verrucomicrobiota bacterium JB022]|nr:PAS domain-containing protein [Verrucomicrobiota bacterium JB022]
MFTPSDSTAPESGPAQELLALARVPIFRFQPAEDRWTFDAVAAALTGGHTTLTTDDWRSHFEPAAGEALDKWIAYVCGEQAGALVEHRCRYHAQGRPHVVLLRAKVQPDGSLRGVMLDETAHHLQQRSLDVAHARLDALLEAFPVATIIVDAEFNLLRCNQEARRIWGDALEEGQPLPQRQATFVDTGEPVAPSQWAIYRAVKESRPVVNDLLHVRPARDGEPCYVLNCAAPVFNSAGEVEGGVSVAFDVTERMRHLNALRNSEAQLRISNEVAKLGSFVWDVVNDDDQWSPELEKLYGFEPGGFPGAFKDWEDRLHPDDRVYARAAAIDALKTGEMNVEFRIVMPDGGTRWLAARASVFFDEEGKPQKMIGVNIDITDQKEAEEAMRASEERYRQLADAMPQLVWTAAGDGRVTYYNVRAQEYKGLREESPGNWVWEPIVHADDMGETRDAWQHALSTREPYQCEHRVAMADGSYRWHLSRALPRIDQETGSITWYGTATDIQDFRETEETLHGFFEGNEVYLAVMELRESDFHYLLVNQHMANFYRRPPESMVGSSSSEMGVDDEIRNWWIRTMRLCARSGKPLKFEYQINRWGRKEWLQCSLNQIASGTMDCPRFALTGVDITALKQSEEDLRVKSEEADRANRAKSEFLAHMSHEIRSPMTAILGYTELLTQMVRGETEQDFLQTIRTEGEHLVQVINDILDLSRIEAGRVELNLRLVSPLELVESVISLMNATAVEKGLPLRLELGDNLPAQIETDPTRLRQILLNLVGNAIKFTEKGEVALRLFRREDDCLCFVIEDTGIGISEEQQERLFQPFSQGDPSVTRKYGGTGLGLVISRRLADLLGASIHLTSEIGQGSTFTVCVPIPEELAEGETATPAAGGTKTEETERSAALSGVEILLVDDRRETRELVCRLLERAEANVRIAQDGKQAVDEVTRKEPDLVVMDMQMPVMDGYQASRRLRANGFVRPIVALTAHAMQGEREKCLQAGCDEHLIKPINARKLVDVLRRLAAGQ